MIIRKPILFLFKFFLLCCAFYLVDSPFIAIRINDYLAHEQSLKLVGYIAQIVLAVLLITSFSISKSWLKYLFLIFFLINSIAYRTYFNAVGTPLFFADFVTLFEARGEMGNAMAAYSPAFYASLWIHIPFLIVYLLFPSLKLGWRGSCIVLAFYLVILSLFTTTLINTQGRGLQGRPGFFQPTVQGVVFGYSLFQGDKINANLIPAERPDLDSFVIEDLGLNTVIMVIDESINWDLIDLNSNLGVTPVLKEFPVDNIINYGKAVSYANCSDISNGSIRKFVRYGHEEADLLGEKAVYMWEAAKKAGFTPYLMDIQRDGKHHNYFTADELSQINIVKVQGTADKDIVDVIVSLIEKAPVDEKQFILLIKGGAHFPYRSVGEDIYSPTMATSSMKNSAPIEIFNSYRNLAFYQTNTFFEDVLNQLDYKHNLAMVYTSDHGQSFRDVNNKETHCNSKNPDLTEAIVPLLVLGPESVLKRSVIQEVESSQKVKSHYLVPALLMDIMGYHQDDIAEFTQYKSALSPNNNNHFIHKRAVPLFESKADKYEVNDIDVINLQNQEIE